MRIGGEALLSWGGAQPDQTLHALLRAVLRLLQPVVGDSPSLGVGEARAVACLASSSAMTQSLLRACCSWPSATRPRLGSARRAAPD